MNINYTEEIAHKKAEINSAIDRYHSTITFMITTTIAILSFGVSIGSSIVTFFALIANMLLWKKASFYKNVMAQHSAYCQVFLENEESGFLWETVNQYVTEGEAKKHQRTVNRYIEWEAIGMNVISLIMTVLFTVFSNIGFHEWTMIEFVQQCKNISWIQASFLLIVIFFFIVSGVKIVCSKNVHQLRCEWIKIFQDLKIQMRINRN